MELGSSKVKNTSWENSISVPDSSGGTLACQQFGVAPAVKSFFKREDKPLRVKYIFKTDYSVKAEFLTQKQICHLLGNIQQYLKIFLVVITRKRVLRILLNLQSPQQRTVQVKRIFLPVCGNITSFCTHKEALKNTLKMFQWCLQYQFSLFPEGSSAPWGLQVVNADFK